MTAKPENTATDDPPRSAKPKSPTPRRAEEVGGPVGPEPTRFGDWEKGGRCSDF